MAAAAAAAYPPWVIFEQFCTLEVQGCSSSIADTNTLVRCRTSTGHPIDVSLCLAAPPEASHVCVRLPDGIVASYGVVFAAHGDSVVIQIGGIEDRRSQTFPRTKSTDYFVYSAGDVAAEPPRPPSLSLLPPHSITYEDEEKRPGCRYLDTDSTGLLRRGEGEFLVAELKMEYVKERDNTVHKEAALHLLRSGSCEWRVKRPVISGYAEAGDQCVNDLASSWQNYIVIPVGEQMLCWVDVARGLLFSDDMFDDGLIFSDDVFDESPSLRYVAFPEDSGVGLRYVCATADGSTVKVVNVIPRCCCGGAGKSKCRVSHHAYVVHTWKLRMDDMTWAMDGSLDATQLWSLDGYKGLPRVELDSAVVSMENSDAICFVVCENHHEKDGDKTAWRIMVDMKSRALGSVFRCPKRQISSSLWDRHLPSRVSKYFNSKPSTGQPPGPAAKAEAMQNLMSSRIKNRLQAMDDTAQAASPEAAILAALQEIPGLDRDEMLKAYRILTHEDSGRRFRSLMGLPMDLRKDCVLMEIKASEACVLCSACSADLQIKESALEKA